MGSRQLTMFIFFADLKHPLAFCQPRDRQPDDIRAVQTGFDAELVEQPQVSSAEPDMNCARGHARL